MKKQRKKIFKNKINNTLTTTPAMSQLNTQSYNHYQHNHIPNTLLLKIQNMENKIQQLCTLVSETQSNFACDKQTIQNQNKLRSFAPKQENEILRNRIYLSQVSLSRQLMSKQMKIAEMQKLRLIRIRQIQQQNEKLAKNLEEVQNEDYIMDNKQNNISWNHNNSYDQISSRKGTDHYNQYNQQYWKAEYLNLRKLLQIFPHSPKEQNNSSFYHHQKKDHNQYSQYLKEPTKLQQTSSSNLKSPFEYSYQQEE